MYFQYDFSLEEKVIAWTESQKETQQVLETVETRRIGDAIEQFARVGVSSYILILFDAIYSLQIWREGQVGTIWTLVVGGPLN